MTGNLNADIEREPDPVDRGSVREMELIEDALEAQRLADPTRGKTVADSATYCQVCGEAIPQARREAVPGVLLCVDCAEALEEDERRWRR